LNSAHQWTVKGMVKGTKKGSKVTGSEDHSIAEIRDSNDVPSDSPSVVPSASPSDVLVIFRPGEGGDFERIEIPDT
jgi:hypothetical protein